MLFLILCVIFTLTLCDFCVPIKHDFLNVSPSSADVNYFYLNSFYSILTFFTFLYYYQFLFSYFMMIIFVIFVFVIVIAIIISSFSMLLTFIFLVFIILFHLCIDQIFLNFKQMTWLNTIQI